MPTSDQVEVRPGRLTFSDLAKSYEQIGMKELAATTQYVLSHAIDDYLIPRWGNRFALEIQPLEIKKWLDSLELANPTKDKWRRTMSVIFKRAQTYGLIPRNEGSNPLRWVKQSAKSRYRAIVVDPSTAARIVASLSGVERALTMLVAATGLRISEALGLKWEDIDWENRKINLRRVWVHETVFDRLKTDESERPVPLSDLLAEYLLAWKSETTYAKSSDWVFPSKKSKGRTPRSASVLTSDYLRPAAIAAGVELKKGQRFGFHNLRHSLATFLVNRGTDVKTVQGLLRHANVTTTLGRYAQTVNASMLAAQETMLQAMKSDSKAVN